MKFQVNAGQFTKSITPVADIATKSIAKEWADGNMITLKAFKDEFVAISHGGSASIIANISDKTYGNLNYVCIEDGISTFSANDLMAFLPFMPQSEDIVVSATPNELRLTVVSDDTICNIIPVVTKDVRPPQLANKFSKTVKVNREMFSAGLARVQFAIGKEIAKPYYKCLLFQTIDSNKVRFAAGSGSRFAVDEIEGKNIVELNNGELVHFIFPDVNVPNIGRILEASAQSEIFIKEASATESNPEQIVIEYEGITIIILGLDKDIKFAEVRKVLDFNYTNRVLTDISQWKTTAGYIDATLKTSEKGDNRYKNADITANFKESRFRVSAATKTSTTSAPKFTKVLAHNGVESIPVCCSSEYIVEIVRNAPMSSGDIEICLEDKTKPIVIKYPTIINETKETTENFSMFFATLKKPE